MVTTATSQAPVYLDANTLVVVYDCCTGYSHLNAFDLRTGRRSAFAKLYGPPVNIIRIGTGRLLVVTAANLLVVASRGHTQQLATMDQRRDGLDHLTLLQRGAEGSDLLAQVGHRLLQGAQPVVAITVPGRHALGRRITAEELCPPLLLLTWAAR
jgi:hypothetical protein